jgi:membrane-associated protease RseP (regulator of RpoE activity)
MRWITNSENRLSSTQYNRPAIIAMYGGLILTILTIVILFVDHATSNVLADHIRAGYPSYSQSRIDSAVMIYLVYLSVIGVLGIVSWLSIIWGASKNKLWTRWVTTVMFVLSMSIGLFNLLVRDTSGDTGLPPLLGWGGMLPNLAGLLVVILLWRLPRQTK